jgi:hypothetical protein
MKIAVCFSGVLRAGVHAFPNIKQYYGDYFNSIDFYMHTWDIEDWGADWYAYPHPLIDDSLWESIVKRKPFKLQDSKLDKMESLYKFKKLETASIFDSYDPNTPVKYEYMWDSFKRSVELKQEYEKENNFKYDIVVKTRPDILFNVPFENTVRNKIRTGTSSFEYSTFENDVKLVQPDNIVAKNCKYDQPGRTLDDVHWMGSNKVMDNLADFSTNTEPITPWDPGDDTIVSQKTWRSGTYCDAKGVKFCEMNSQLYCILRDHLVHLDPIEDYYKIKREGY